MGAYLKFIRRLRRAFDSTGIGRSLRRSQYRKRLQEKLTSQDTSMGAGIVSDDWDGPEGALMLQSPAFRRSAAIRNLAVLWIVVALGLGAVYAYQKGYLLPWLNKGKSAAVIQAGSLIRAVRLQGDSPGLILEGGLALSSVADDKGLKDKEMGAWSKRVKRGVMGIFGLERAKPENLVAAQIPPESAPFTEEAMDVLLLPPVPGQPDQQQPKASVPAADVPKAATAPVKAVSPVIIYHTHTSETFRDQGCSYLWEKYKPDLTQEYVWKDKPGVVTVGTALEEALEAQGIAVVHSKKVNDYPVFREAYKNALPVIEGLLKEHGDALAVLDIHRDGLVKNGSVASVRIGGSQVAPVFIVVTSDKYGLPHPDWKRNYAFALSLEKAINASYPGLCRGVDLRDDARWNQHVHPHAVILEIGSNLNTTEEALATAELLAVPLAKVVKEP